MKNIAQLIVLGAAIFALTPLAKAGGFTTSDSLNFGSIPGSDTATGIQFTGTPETLMGGGQFTGFSYIGMTPPTGESFTGNSFLSFTTPANTQLFTLTKTGTGSVKFVTNAASQHNVQMAGIDSGNTLDFYDTGTLYLYDANGNLIASGAAYVSVATAGGAFFVGFIQATPTPEPSSLILLGTGLLGAAGVAFRKRNTLA